MKLLIKIKLRYYEMFWINSLGLGEGGGGILFFIFVDIWMNNEGIFNKEIM